MFSFESEAMLVDDREDLIAVLQMRFGTIESEMIEEIYQINDFNVLQRLIISAANVASWEVFLEEYQAGSHSFRLLGERFNPLRDRLERRDHYNGKGQ